jgi:16S rRNA (cytosine967-C5)-methyltransferase
MPKSRALPSLEHGARGCQFQRMAAPSVGATGAAPSARAVALDLLGSVLWRRQALDEALAAHRGLPLLEPRDRAFARQLVATTLRRLGQIDALIAHAMAEPLPERARPVTDILRLGVAQLAFLGTPSHAAVSTAVDLVETIGHRKMKGLVNAVLRRLAREAEGLVASQDAARLNTPDRLWESWCAAYGEAATREIAAAHVKDPPLDLTLRDPSAIEDWATRLGGTVLPTGTIRRADAGLVTELPGYADGGWWVQDAAASLLARLLRDVAGKTVIDLCAAPGGKTAQLAAAGARVIAVDRSPSRVVRLKENLSRLSLAADCVIADAATWRPAEPASQILLDAPCTATGTIRRHPDIPHLKSVADVARLTQLQRRLLEAAAAMLAPGGTLIYGVCSLEVEEGPRQIEQLLARGAPMMRSPIAAGEIGGLAACITSDGDLRTLPHHLAERGGLDGFYAARLTKTSPK